MSESDDNTVKFNICTKIESFPSSLRQENNYNQIQLPGSPENNKFVFCK